MLDMNKGGKIYYELWLSNANEYDEWEIDYSKNHCQSNKISLKILPHFVNWVVIISNPNVYYLDIWYRDQLPMHKIIIINIKQ